MLSTLVQIAGGETSDNSDGISFYPELVGGMQPGYEYLFWEFPAYGGQVAVRVQNWKAVRRGLIKYPDAPIELYNLASDEAEMHDVADEFPFVIEDIKSIMIKAHVPSDEFPFPALDSIYFANQQSVR